MTRMVRAAAAAVSMAGAAGGVGCTAPDPDRGRVEARYSNLVDPCWPQRYSFVARQEVLAPFAMQVGNAEVVDRTLQNYHFESETDKLTPGGVEKLSYLTRKRPAPDPHIYLATARDFAYDPAKPDRYVTERSDLDAKRTQAILKYVTADTASRPVPFEVTVIDPYELTMPANLPATAVRGLPFRYQSGITGQGGQLTGVGGGGVAGGAAGGGGVPIGPSAAGGGPSVAPR